MAVARSRASREVRDSRRYQQELRALGLRVRALRTQRDWTIERAAEAIEIDPTHLAKIEAGSINVTFATLIRLAVGFGAKVADLFIPR